MSSNAAPRTQPPPATPAAVTAAAPAPDSAPPRRWPAVTVRAPARPAPAAALHSIAAATTVLLGLVAIGALIHEPVLIPPLAASAALVHSAPTLPLAQPRNLVIGHLAGSAVGYAVLAAAGSSAWAAAVAAGLTLGLNMVARTPHSPAVATAVIIVLQTPAPGRFIPLLFGATVLLVLTGYAASRVRRKARSYPVYWW
ncbi:HPP family protein [Streptomyces sp. NPDC091371]|uniref:HPP family protein n=1 Tax=Streptomyces sp. NPDC091371 TaxID=3155303 RepID=UPI003426EFAD